MVLRPEDYYPPGSYRDSRAPWNQHENDEHEFDVIISQTLSKETTVLSKDYIKEQDEESGNYNDDTSEINWNKEYDENHLTPLELIKEFESFLIKNLQKGYYDNDKEKAQINYLLDECEGWTEDEIEVIKN